MTITTLSSREFNQDASKAKKAAQTGPVIITDRGRPAHVLMTFEDYKHLTRQPTRIADLLTMPEAQDADFEALPPRELAQATDLS
jgi:prevent-host-death family protein